MKFYFRFIVDGITRFAMIEAASSGAAQKALQKSIEDAYGEQDEGTYEQNPGNGLYIDFGTGNVDPDTIRKLSARFDIEIADEVAEKITTVAGVINYINKVMVNP